MKSRTYIFLSILWAFTLIACEKTLITYTDIPGNDLTEESKDSSRVRLNFQASIGNFSTKSTTTDPIQTNRYINIYAFGSLNTRFTNSYVSKKSGSLSPLDSALKVPIGSYSFYGAGINRAATKAPVFSADGFFTGLSYNQDYIWWATYNQTPVYPVTDYDILFQHCYTQVVFDLQVADSILVNDIQSFNITPSEIKNLSWSLYYGTIGPASGISSDTLSMNYSSPGKNQYITQVMMPPVTVKETTHMNYGFRIKINNEVAYRTYLTQIPVFQNQLKPGYSYRYELQMQTDNVTLGKVTIIDWTDVDGSNKPIIPSESE